ncbi:MAG: DUF1501 domain-containing protein [Planctomycetes bacterium]|nr:DUF1501 domain-containing protein [Planctomycetota bacterium]
MSAPIDCRHTASPLADLHRRTFLGTATAGLGGALLAALCDPHASAADESAANAAVAPDTDRWLGVVRPLHHAARAKRVIYLCMAGGPSHLESFDDKPKLAEMHGQPMPASYTEGKPIAQLQGRQLNCFAPQHAFKTFGEAGQRVAEIFPHIGAVADSICIINSMQTEAINHDPAHTFMNTGTTIAGRPAMGAWINYGLGSESDSLPGFVVLTSIGKFGQAQPIAARQWHSGFLPSRFQGVEFRSTGDPVLYVGNPRGVDRQRQRDVIDAVQKLNSLQDQLVHDPEIATRISAYETAFRMQQSVPELVDLKGEPKHVLDMYGTEGGDGSFAANCLLGRRLVERGVRFVQLYHRGWDHHGGVKSAMQNTAGEVDRASAALLKDLQQRDMLKDTLVVWGGDFGRTPMAQGNGRDHHIRGFSLWMAGGGIKGGITWGKTDELGYEAVENIVHVNDFHATILHLLGIDHRRLTFRFQGRDFRLTDVAGHIVKDILA